MNKRLAIIAQKAAKEAKETCMLDAYNNSFCTDVSVTITTRVYACNHYYIMEKDEINTPPVRQVPQVRPQNKQPMLNVITLFSGYDSQALALNRLGIPYDLAAWCEIDRHAITAHNALFPQWKDRNLGDVSRVDWAEWHSRHPQPIDLLTYSSPCQDVSSAGLQRGGEEGSGTRSGLLWEVEKAIAELRPRTLVFENVAALVSDKFIGLFNRWQTRLNGYGYTNFSQLMNAKDYGVPQNRLRIFMVSILDCPRAYYFPRPFPLTRRLKDVLEQNVAERYYLKEESVERLFAANKEMADKGNGFRFEPAMPPYDKIGLAVKATASWRRDDNFVAEPKVEIIADLQPDNKMPGSNVVRQQNMLVGVNGLSPCIPATHTKHEFKIAEPQMLGWTRNEKGEITDRHPVNVANCVTAAKRDNTQNYVMEPSVIELPVEKAHQQDAIQHEDGISRCLVVGSHGNSAFFTNTAVTTPQGIRIRRLSERELYRLMDLEEKDIDTLLNAPIPRTQHAKLAGNSIVVASLYYIFRNLFVNTEPEAGTQTKLF